MHEVGVNLHPGQFILQEEGLDGVKGTGEVKKKKESSQYHFSIQVCVGSMDEVKGGILNLHFLPSMRRSRRRGQ